MIVKITAAKLAQQSFARNFSVSSTIHSKSKKLSKSSSSQLTTESLAQSQFKCGLEIHCQLKTTRKLFSDTEHTFNESPNSRVSYFDAGLPGSQPKLNPEAVLLALIAGVALNGNINYKSTFDRKHYFYGDQPLGYQLTQRYNPISHGGWLRLTKKFDDIDQQEKIIHFDQIQIEQDTGKSVHVEDNSGGMSSVLAPSQPFAKIDLNRANVPLIEVVTCPDFEDLKQVKAFLRKFQSLVKFLNISTGDLETGAMRVDVNVSVHNGQRVEIKNLSSSTAILAAIKYEYQRQLHEIAAGKQIAQETRGWDGAKTTKIRNKETAVDYRYMPDPELSPIHLSKELVAEVKQNFVQSLPDDVIEKLVAKPFDLRVKDAKLLVSDTYPGLLEYYLRVFRHTAAAGARHPDGKTISAKVPGNMILHELIGQLTKHDLPFSPNIIPVSKLVELIEAIHLQQKLTTSSGKLLLSYMVENHSSEEIQTKLIDALIDEFDLATPQQIDGTLQGEIVQLCEEIMAQFPEIVANLQSGQKLNSLQYLVGQAMRSTQGKIPPKIIEAQFKKLIGME